MGTAFHQMSAAPMLGSSEPLSHAFPSVSMKRPLKQTITLRQGHVQPLSSQTIIHLGSLNHKVVLKPGSFCPLYVGNLLLLIITLVP